MSLQVKCDLCGRIDPINAGFVGALPEGWNTLHLMSEHDGFIIQACPNCKVPLDHAIRGLLDELVKQLNLSV